MKSVPKDYQPPEGGESTFADGKYKVKGISWFSLTDDKKPMLVEQGGRLVGRLRFMQSNDEPGPPMSISLGQMGLLVQAFGGDLDSLGEPPQEQEAGKVSSFMEHVVAIVNNASGEIEVEVKGGWVNTLPVDIVGNVCFRLIDMFSKENDLRPTQGQYGPWFGVVFEVVAGSGGGPTPLKGAEFSEILSYAVEVGADGEPDFTRTSTGAWTLAAKRMSNLMAATAPKWVSSWDGSSDFTFQNPDNLLPEWLAAALSEDQVLSGYRGVPEDGGRVRLNWATLEVVKYSEPKKSKPAAAAPAPKVDPEETDVKARSVLVDLLNLLADGPAFEDEANLVLSGDVGKATARQYLTPLKKKGLLKVSVLSELGYDQVMVILENVEADDKADEVQELKHKLAAIGIGVDVEEEAPDF